MSESIGRVMRMPVAEVLKHGAAYGVNPNTLAILNALAVTVAEQLAIDEARALPRQRRRVVEMRLVKS